MTKTLTAAKPPITIRRITNPRGVTVGYADIALDGFLDGVTMTLPIKVYRTAPRVDWPMLPFGGARIHARTEAMRRVEDAVLAAWTLAAN